MWSRFRPHRRDPLKVPHEVRVAGLRIEGLAPASAAGTAMTKAGRLSLRGRTSNGRAVKVVEAYSPEHAVFIRRLSEDTLSEMLPTIAGVEGSLVVSLWVERDPSAANPCVEALTEMLARIHAIPRPQADSPFDAWNDYVLPRARRVARTLGMSDRLEELLEPAHRPTPSIGGLLTHADLTPNNVVPTSDGHRIVDNELLGIGSALGLDLANLARGLKQRQRETLDRYRDAGGHPIDETLLEASRAMWLARLLGSLFLEGRLGECRDLLAPGSRPGPLPFE